MLIPPFDLTDVHDLALSLGPQSRDQEGHPRPDVRTLHPPSSKLGRPHHNGSMGVAEDDLGPHPHEFVREIHPGFEHLLVDQNRALSLGRRDEGDGGQVGREGWPRSVIHLRDVAEGVGVHCEFPVPVDDQR